MKFSEWLKGELDRRGWQQSELVRRADLTRATISNLVRGEKGPGPESCIQIAKAMEIPIETVFRAAGFLPTRDTDITFDHVLDIMKTMSPETRKQLLALAIALKSHHSNNNEGG